MTDPPLQLCLLPEAAQLSCLPGPKAAKLARSPGRKHKPSGQSYCVDLGVGRHSLVKARMCAILFHLFRGHTTKIFLKSTIQQKKRTQLYDISRKSTRDQETTNRPTYQRLYVWTRELSSLTREVRHGASRPDPHEICVSRVNRNVADRVGSGQQVFKISRVGSSQVETTQIFRGPGRVR